MGAKLSPLDSNPVDRRCRDSHVAQAMAAVKRAMYEDALVWSEGNVLRAAEALDTNRISLINGIARMGIDVPALLARAEAGLYEYQSRWPGTPWA